jgi:hypothetical protein
MLRPQARLFAPGADVADLHRLAEHGRQAKRRAQNLAAAFAGAAVNC